MRGEKISTKLIKKQKFVHSNSKMEQDSSRNFKDDEVFLRFKISKIVQNSLKM